MLFLCVSIPHRQAKNQVHTLAIEGLLRVSIPHRQAKNLVKAIGLPDRGVFQFLIGRLKTIERFKGFVRSKRVSIPHRQAKNDKGRRQFLTDVLVSIPHRQAKNVENTASGSVPKTRFQFLIGRLKTGVGLAGMARPVPVSISHRQAKNVVPGLYPLQLYPVSIPHRQAKNPLVLFRKREREEVSIPHRQAKNPSGREWARKLQKSFNSSQVG